MKDTPYPDNKALASALAYLARFAPEELKKLNTGGGADGPWTHWGMLISTGERFCGQLLKDLDDLLAKPPKANFAEKIAELWPPLWMRHRLPLELLTKVMQAAFKTTSEKSSKKDKRPNDRPNMDWSVFSGIPESSWSNAF